MCTFYEIFTELCDFKSVTMRKACLDIGISPSATSKWKKRGSYPHDTTIKKIEKYFNVAISIEDGDCYVTDLPEYDLLEKGNESWLEKHATDDPKDEGLKKILSYLGGLSEDDMLKLRDIVDTLLK